MSISLEQKLMNLIDKYGRNLQSSDVQIFLDNEDFDINKEVSSYPDKVRTSIITQAIKRCDYDVIELLVQHTPGLVNFDNRETYGPTYSAVMRGDKDIVDLLMKSGANFNLKSIGGSPIELAAYWGYIDVVKTILGNCGDTERAIINCQEALATSIDRDHYAVAKLLLKSGKVDVNYEVGGYSALEKVFYSCDSLSIESSAIYIKLLIDHDADIHRVSTSRDSAMNSVLELILNAEEPKYSGLIEPLLKGYLDDVEIRFQDKFNNETRINANKVSNIKKKMAKRTKIGGLKI